MGERREPGRSDWAFAKNGDTGEAQPYLYKEHQVAILHADRNHNYCDE